MTDTREVWVSEDAGMICPECWSVATLYTEVNGTRVRPTRSPRLPRGRRVAFTWALDSRAWASCNRCSWATTDDSGRDLYAGWR